MQAEPPLVGGKGDERGTQTPPGIMPSFPDTGEVARLYARIGVPIRVPTEEQMEAERGRVEEAARQLGAFLGELVMMRGRL